VGLSVVPSVCQPKLSNVLDDNIDTSNLVSRWTVAPTSERRINSPFNGHGQGHVARGPLEGERSRARKCQNRFSAVTSPHGWSDLIQVRTAMFQFRDRHVC